MASSRQSCSHRDGKTQSTPAFDQFTDVDLDELSSITDTYLTKKERILDSFVHQLIAGQQVLVEEGLDLNERHQRLSHLVDKKMSSLSTVLRYKLSPIIKSHLEEMQRVQTMATFSKISRIKPDMRDMSVKYGRFFQQWINSPQVYFKVSQTQALGNLSLRDAFIFHLFVFCTVRRERGDGLYALSVCGRLVCIN